jgi:hypothetical protein
VTPRDVTRKTEGQDGVAVSLLVGLFHSLQHAGLSRRTLKNADGSVDLYFSPTAPKGFENNWIPTVPGQAWFTYLRLYAPTEDYFDKTWKLPDIEKVK